MREDSKNKNIEKDILTFEELRTIQKRGRTNDSLQSLDSNFLERVRFYLKIKKKMADKLSTKEYENAVRVISDIMELRERKIVRLAELSSKTKIPLKNLLPEEKEFLENMKSQFIKYHEIINSKLNSENEKQENDVEIKKEDSKKEDNQENLSQENDKISETLENNGNHSVIQKNEVKEEYSENLKGEIKNNREKIKSDLNKENKYEKYRILIKGPVPEFLGIDLEVYGPFKENDIAELPEKNAQVLINQGLAENINKVFQQT